MGEEKIKKKVLLTHSVTPSTIKLARKLTVDVIAYEQDFNDPMNADILLKQVCLSMEPELVFKWQKELIERSRAYCQVNRNILILPVIKMVLGEYSVQKFFQQYVARTIKDDYRLIILGEYFFPNDSRIYLFSHPDISSFLLNKGQALCSGKANKWPGLKKMLGFFIYLFCWACPKGSRWNSGSANIVFEPYHGHDICNDEFHHINHFLENGQVSTIYFFRDFRNELSRALSRKGGKVVGWHNLRLDLPTFVRGMGVFISCLAALFVNRKVPLILKFGWFHLLFEHYKYMALLKTVAFRYLLKERGDLFMCSTMLKELVKHGGAKTIGYSHSTYFFPEYYLSGVDFDYYGYSGLCELDTYREYWPKEGVDYISTGQMSVERTRNVKTWESLGRKKKEGEAAFGIFPTSVDKYTLPYSPEVFHDFIKMSFKCVSKHTKDQLIVKDKLSLKIRRNDKGARYCLVEEARGIMERYSGLYGLSPLVTWIDSDNPALANLSAVEGYHLIDMGFVLGESTCAFELLALQKKVLVYIPFKSVVHPFKKYSPLLVANDIDEFESNFDVLVNMKENEYQSYIEATINYCGRKSNGHLVEDFLSSIDNSLFPNN